MSVPAPPPKRAIPPRIDHDRATSIMSSILNNPEQVTVGRVLAVVSVLSNGYVVTMVPAQPGMMLEGQYYAKDEADVGQVLLNHVAKKNCE